MTGPDGRPGDGSGEAEPRYAQPVDPWATGEAAAFGRLSGNEPWLASTEPESAGGTGGGGAAPGGRWRAYRKWLVGVAVVVLGVAATVTYVLWQEYPALGFHPLSDAKHVPPAVALGSGFAAVALQGDRAYFANVDDSYDQSERLGVVATDAASGKHRWANPDVGEAAGWEQFLATPEAVVAISARDYTKDNRLMVLLDPADGKVLWQRFIGGSDNVLFTGDVVVQIDQVGKRVVGLDVHSKGDQRWSLPNPKSKYDLSTAAVIRVTSVGEHTGPATVSGATFDEPSDADRRIVLIGADRSAQIIDTGTGKVARTLQNVADPDDEVIAHNGRLTVAESDTLRRVVSYDLDKSGQPKVLYNPPDTNVRVEHLTECGADRVCFLSTVDSTKAEVMAVDAADGGLLWHRPLTEIDGLVPVGDSLLAIENSPTQQVRLLDAKGAVTWTKPGEVARLDAGNLLLFTKQMSNAANQPSLSGEHLGDGPVLLGPLGDQRSSTCAWNTSVIACAGEKDFEIQEFAS